MVDKTELVIEKDDEGNYRVLSENNAYIDAGLCKAIIASLQQIES